MQNGQQLSSKSEILGKKILDRTLGRNKDYGGILTEITGAPGSSKTSILLSFTKHTMILHPDEKVFWREQTDAPLQIFKLGAGTYHFMVKDTSNVVFRDRDNHLKPVDLHPTFFHDYEDLFEKAKPGVANVVFFDNKLVEIKKKGEVESVEHIKADFEWMPFITSLRNVGEWVNVFIDEIADVCPAVNSGDLFYQIRDFAGTMGAVRRCMMNVFYNSQTVQDIDWRIRKKVMLKVFLPGAIADRYSRITQQAIDNLVRDPVNGNEAFLDMGGEFGKVRFKDIYKPVEGKHIEAHIPQIVPVVREEKEDDDEDDI